MATYIPQGADGSTPIPATIVPVAGGTGAGFLHLLRTDVNGQLQILNMNAAGASAVNIQDGGNVISVDDGGTSFTVDQATATNLKAQAEVYMGGVAVASSAPLQVAASDRTDAIYSAGTSKTPLFSAFGGATSGDNILATNTNGGFKIRVLSLMLVAGVATNIYFRDDGGGGVIFGGSTNKIKLAANGGFVLPYNPLGWMQTATNGDLVCNADTTGPIAGGVIYIEI